MFTELNSWTKPSASSQLAPKFLKRLCDLTIDRNAPGSKQRGVDSKQMEDMVQVANNHVAFAHPLLAQRSLLTESVATNFIDDFHRQSVQLFSSLGLSTLLTIPSLGSLLLSRQTLGALLLVGYCKLQCECLC